MTPRVFSDLPPRPIRPPTDLNLRLATDIQARDYYREMMEYWRAEANWQRDRADTVKPTELVVYRPCALHQGATAWFEMTVGFAPPVREICPVCTKHPLEVTSK